MVLWEKGKILGFGGSSTVYECKLGDSDNKIAVKEINKNGLSPVQCQVIEAEIDLLRGISHPNVIQYIGTECTSTHFYIFLEYAERGSLRQIYLKHGPLQDTFVVYFLRQILSGLLYLHMKGIAHRDVKAANILITHDGVAKLGDFGSSKKIIMESLVSGIKGTPHFMAPEVIKGTQEETGWFKADIWAIGCLVIELHSAAFPYAAKYENSMTVMFKIASGEAPPIDSSSSSELLTCIIQSCCTIEPAARPAVEDLIAHPFLSSPNNCLTDTREEILKLIAESDDIAGVDGVDSIDLEESDDQPLVNVYPSFASKTTRQLPESKKINRQPSRDMLWNEKNENKLTNEASPIRAEGKSKINGKFRFKSLPDDSDNAVVSIIAPCTQEALQYSATTQIKEGVRPKAPITGEMIRLGSSEILAKAGLSGSAAVRRIAKEDLEKNVLPVIIRSKRAVPPLLTRESATTSNRSMSADIVYAKRNLPSLDVNSQEGMDLNSSLPRYAQSAPNPSSSVKRLSPLILVSSQTPKGSGRKSNLPTFKSTSRGNWNSGVSPNSVIKEESDQAEP